MSGRECETIGSRQFMFREWALAGPAEELCVRPPIGQSSRQEGGGLAWAAVGCGGGAAWGKRTGLGGPIYVDEWGKRDGRRPL